MNNTLHIPVLKEEATKFLITDVNGIYVDATLGYGGHTLSILDNTSDNSKVFAIDKDIDAIIYNKSRISNEERRLTLKHGCFSSLDDYAKEWNVYGSVDGILFDLGVSSVHLDNADRGFSFNKNSALDMRFDRSNGKPLSEYINTLSESEIEKILRLYGQEKFAKRIAKNIIKFRKNKEITTTFELVDIINKSVLVNEKNKHNATRSFQALRIFINNELDVLRDILNKSYGILSSNGRLVLITYHSLEERIIKDFMIYTDKKSSLPRKLPIKDEFMKKMFNLVKKVKPQDQEIKINPRSRSARMSILEKVA